MSRPRCIRWPSCGPTSRPPAGSPCPTTRTCAGTTYDITFVSLLIAQGVNIKAIATQAGHSSAAFTLDVYGHLMPGSNDELRSALSAAWASTTTPSVVPWRKTEDAA
jgi:hypothetical protein